MPEKGRDGQQAERRALVADLVRTQAVLQARSEQLQRIFASRWYRLARFFWRARRPRAWRRGGGPPRMAGESSFARPLNGDAIAAERRREAAERQTGAVGDVLAAPGLEGSREARPTGSLAGSRLLLAGHSLGFCAGIARWAAAGGATVRADRWRGHDVHDPAASAAALDWADVVLCEWCLGNAVHYSRAKRPGQRLVVRFHRMELETGHPAGVDLERVDAMVFVARHMLEEACERFGWDAEDPRFLVVPNGIDPEALRLGKLDGAELTLGMVGYVPSLKRLDRALDMLEPLRERDERWRLLVKGREPWEHGSLAARPEERLHYESLARRLRDSPGLHDAVELEPHGDDVAGFLRRTGWLLSTSEVEGHSVALAEGMASGAVPVVLDRPGAVEQYGERWVHADPTAAARAIHTALERGEHGAQSEAASRHAERWSWQRLAPTWERLLAGEPISSAGAGESAGESVRRP